VGSGLSSIGASRPAVKQCRWCRAGAGPRAHSEVVRIAPVVHEAGLIAYECPACSCLRSELWHPNEPDSRGAGFFILSQSGERPER
jgi:hypothetical protein